MKRQSRGCVNLRFISYTLPVADAMWHSHQTFSHHCFTRAWSSAMTLWCILIPRLERCDVIIRPNAVMTGLHPQRLLMTGPLVPRDKMNCWVRFGNCFLRVPLMYQPCCLVPGCQGKLGELRKNQLTKPQKQFILSLGTVPIRKFDTFMLNLVLHNQA